MKTNGIRGITYAGDHSLPIHSFFFIRTSNFDAEAERSYIFWRFEAETFLKMFLMFLKMFLKMFFLDNTSDFVSPDDFDGVEVILEQL